MFPFRIHRGATMAKAKAKPPSRRARLARALRSALAVAWVTGLVLLVMLVGRDLLSGDRFRVDALHFEGNARATSEELRALAAVARDTNVFRAPLSEIEARLTTHPWVRSVEVSRLLPRSLHVRVEEWEPALLVSAGELYIASDDAAIIKAFEPGDPWQLPVVTGLDRTTLEGGGEELSLAASLVRSWAARDLPEIAEVRLDARRRAEVRTVDGVKIFAGHAPYDTKLDAMRRLSRTETFLDVAQVRLDDTRRRDRLVVRLRDGAAGRM
ncbi:MAG: FtsQ-type POTRA domain-containing protein [Myxococcales bacterium]|nr:FtsQ-type POTRA domain-containing protein [Myxococcales bacterium]